MKTIQSPIPVRVRFRPVLLVCTVLLSAFCYAASAQILINEVKGKESVKANRNRGLEMLRTIKETIEEHYYDKNFRGIDLDARFKAAEEKIKTLETNSEIFRAIAVVLLEFGDSHTRFVPPGRHNRVEYGFTTQMIGADCVVTDVKAGSDAEQKGLKPGDVIVAFGKHDVTRDNLWEINYNLYSLDPLPRLQISVKNDDGTRRTLVIDSSVKSFEERKAEEGKRRKEKEENPYKCRPVSTEVIACRLETFSVEKHFIDKMMSEASQYKKLILDLRGNGGGLVSIEEYLTGHFFDTEVKIATFKTRKKTEERIARPQKKRAFKGELIVLVDSLSASASEVFSRVIQLEKRGTIVGDVTAGAVMTSYYIPLAVQRGYSTFAPFGLSVTVADLIMSDGNRLENVGVIPDKLVGPSRAAFQKKTDPILSYAAGLFGAKLTAEEAGKFQFVKKRFEDEDDNENGPDKAPEINN